MMSKETWLLVVLLYLLHLVLSALEFKYHTEEELEQFLRKLNSDYPHLTRLYSIGKSVSGRELWVLAIGKHVSKPVPLVPNVKYVGNVHGNEVVGREMLLLLAQHYLTMYERNNTIQHFLDTTNIHLLPCLNPDGFNISKKLDCNGVVGRANDLNFDLNRNFPDKYNPSPPPIQEETAAVIAWVQSTHFVLSANLHGGALVVNYPFDVHPKDVKESIYSASPDDDVFRYLSLVYSRSHSTMHRGRHCGDSFQDGITNGAKWYPVFGGLQDYIYRNASMYAVLIEMSCCKYPSPSELPRMWTQNKDALLNFLFCVHMGVKGIIYTASEDNSTIAPLKGAFVTVQGREEIPFYTKDMGEYYKLLLPGEYVLMVSYPQLETKTARFTVRSSDVTRLDIVLSPKVKNENIFRKGSPLSEDNSSTSSRVITGLVWTLCLISGLITV